MHCSWKIDTWPIFQGTVQTSSKGELLAVHLGLQCVNLFLLIDEQEC